MNVATLLNTNSTNQNEIAWYNLVMLWVSLVSVWWGRKHAPAKYTL